MLDASSRPKWPYTLGVLGGLAIGLATWLLVPNALEHPRSSDLVKAVGWGMAIDGAVLGVAWIGVFQQKQCGFGVIAGSFAVPAAIVYLQLPRDEWDVSSPRGMILLVALAGFAMAHIFVRDMPVTRVLAVLAFTGFVLEIAVDQKKVIIEDGPRSLVTVLSLGSLGALGVAAGLEISRLFSAPPRDDGDEADASL